MRIWKDGILYESGNVPLDRGGAPLDTLSGSNFQYPSPYPCWKPEPRPAHLPPVNAELKANSITKQ